jgi:hypothetical protein
MNISLKIGPRLQGKMIDQKRFLESNFEEKNIQNCIYTDLYIMI